ncbi:MAG: radical SAM protein [Acidobacteria bacterium]|nr:radical SAM protein [Acidobacteriota bacterium]
MTSTLRVILLKPSKYGINGYVERFWKGFIPNSTLPFMRSLTPEKVDDCRVEVIPIDEYVQSDLEYLKLLQNIQGPTLVALIGVQSHQFHRALDLAALAHRNGAHVVIGGPHPMTCDTSMLQNRGISFALAEAELVWPTILRDAIRGEMKPVYGSQERWQQELEARVTLPPSPRDLKRYVMPMLGLYPARGCPFNCNFCAITKIAGRRIRTHPVDITLQSLRAAREAGVKLIMFTSDNFNKIPEVEHLLEAIAREDLGMKFFVQCDTQIGTRDRHLIPLLAKAGCFQMFLGIESFDRDTLKAARKFQNRPEHYAEIVRLCRANGIATHFSNIIGFPGDTEEQIKYHLAQVQALNPSVVSCYILTPIPGTDQYDDFLEQGLIYEKNLDRFDGTWSTWVHDRLGPPQLRKLLFRFYRDFYNVGDSLRHAWQDYVQSQNFSNFVSGMGNMLFVRWNSIKQFHPMSGGLWRIKLDHVKNYLDLRKKYFDFELVPLPLSLTLRESED